MIRIQSGMICWALSGMLLVALCQGCNSAAREAAQRNQEMNMMRLLVLGLNSFESNHHHFPAHAICDKDGKPLLSWRVAILPDIEEGELYKQFHLDEPWDSDHNKPLIAKMPSAYAKPGRPNEGRTVFLAPVGKGLAWEGTLELKLGSFIDGTSRTLLLVEANDDRAAVWSKPDDLDVDLDKPLAGLGDALPAGFIAAFVDGHTMVLRKDIDPQTLKALFTRNGHEQIDESKL